MNGPKTTAFVTACGVAAAGLGLVSASMPFFQKKDAPAAVSTKAMGPEVRACDDGEKELARAALYNYGRRIVGQCFMFSGDHQAQVTACGVDPDGRRINARGQFVWRSGLVRKNDHNFTAAFSTDLSGTEIRVNITSRSRDSDAECDIKKSK